MRDMRAVEVSKHRSVAASNAHRGPAARRAGLHVIRGITRPRRFKVADGGFSGIACCLMIDTIKKTLLAGVGAVVITKEKAEAVFEDFVRQGKISSNDARIMAEKISEQGRREFEEVSASLQTKIKDLLGRDEGDTKLRVAALESRVALLEHKLAAEPTRAGEP
jgi:polyhydroxyalkanoate synthesis regulator phasin